MRVVSRVNQSGLFAEDVILADDEALPEGCIESRPPEGFYHPAWDGDEWIEGAPERVPTEAALEEEARKEALQRLAGEAESELAATFINPNDVLGLLSSVVKRLVDEAPVTLGPEEQAALDLLHGEYGNAVAKKAEVAEADPKDLDDIRWRE